MFSDPAQKIKDLEAFHLANILSLRYGRLLNLRRLKKKKNPLRIDRQRLCGIKIS